MWAMAGERVELAGVKGVIVARICGGKGVSYDSDTYGKVGRIGGAFEGGG